MKKTCLISCPIDTYSGYGARSRDIVKSIIKAKGEEWDIKILSQKWGNLPFGYLSDHNEIDLANRVTSSVKTNPEIWIQITIPNEFQRVGTKFNIGITAGIETDLCDKTWIEGINRMDEIWVSSNHAKDVFKSNPQVKPTKPIKVVFEGLDTNIFHTDVDVPNLFDLSTIEEEFAFLYVGHWIGRKNVEGLLSAFFDTFKDADNQPALILKTQMQSSSVADKTRLQEAIQGVKAKFGTANLPNVYVIHGELTNWEMNELYNHKKVKAMVSATRGEGFGRPLLEFCSTGKPVIATNWSGHKDFLNSKYTHLIFGDKVEVPANHINNWIVKGSKWFEPTHHSISTKLAEVFTDYDKLLSKAQRQKQYVMKKFTTEHMNSLVSSLVSEIDSKIPKEVKLQLPKL